MNEEADVVVVHRSPTQRKGFAQIPHAILTDPALSDGAVRLYGILLSYAFQGESFKCGQTKMARDIGKDDRTIRRLLKELHGRGLVTPVRQGQRMVNIYVLEDAYTLYDSERPQSQKRVRNASSSASKSIPNEKGQDKNVRSESDRTKTPGHAGQKRPVTQDKNVLLLKTPEMKIKENNGVSASLFQETEAVQPWAHLTEAQQQPYRVRAEQQLVGLVGFAGWQSLRASGRDRQVNSRAETLYKAAQKEGGE